MKKRFYVGAVVMSAVILLFAASIAEATNRAPYRKTEETKTIYTGCMVEAARLGRRGDKFWADPILVNLRAIEQVDGDEGGDSVEIWMKTGRIVVSVKDKAAFMHQLKECNK